MEKSQREKLQRFSIRKLSIGAVSCLIGTVAFLSDSHDVQAAEKPQTVETAKAENEIQPEKAQESKPNEEAKGDTQNAAADKDAVGSQKVVDNDAVGSQNTDSLTTVSQASTKEKTPLTDSAERESKAAITTPVKQDTTTLAKQDDVNQRSNVPKRVHLKRQQKMGVSTNQVLSSAENKALLANLAENKVANNTGVTTPVKQDGAANEKLIGTGKKASVSLSDGSTLTISNNVLDDKNTSAILTFQSGSFKAGDTYQIKIPKKGHLNLDEVDVANLQQGMGTTTFDDSDENYWIVTDNFTSTGTIKQDIKINRYDQYDNGRNLKDYIHNIFHNSIQLSKNGEEKTNLNIDEIDKTYGLAVMVKDPYKYSSKGLLFNNDENKIASYNVIIHRQYSSAILESNDEIHISSTIENLDWAIPNKVLVNGEESNFTYDSNNKELIVPLNLITGKLDFKVDVMGRVNVDQDKFDSHHKLYVHNEIGVRTKINNIEATDSDTMSVNVIDSVQNLTTGDMFQIDQSYEAGYYDNNYLTGITSKTYKVNNGYLNSDYIGNTQAAIRTSGIIDIQNVTGKTLDNVSVDADIPDGIDLTNVDLFSNLGLNEREKVDMKTIISYIDGSSDIFNTSELEWSNDVLNPNNNKKIKHIKLELNDFNPGLKIRLRSAMYYDLSSVQKENTKIAEKYADGIPVAPGDLITFKETISANGQKDTVDTGYLRLVDHNHDMYNLDLGPYPHQSNKSPNVQDAGKVGYIIAGIKPGDSPVVYVRVPKNATLTGDKPLFRTDPSSDNNTPINYQLLHVGDSVFMKVQLPKNTSGSARLTVHYGTIPDGQTSKDQLAYAVSGIDTDSYNHKQDSMHHSVFADYYDGNIEYDNSPEIINDFNALFKREGINLKDVAYAWSSYSSNGHKLTILESTWDVLTSEGISTISMTDSNMNPVPNMDSAQDVHGEHPDTFNIYGSIINATDQIIKGATQVINVPDNSDGKSQFNPVLNGPVHLIDAVTGHDLSGLVEITYSTQKSDLSDPESTIRGVSADQVTDWSQIKSAQVHFKNNSLPGKTSARAVLTLKDPHIYDDIGKTIYASNKTFTKDQQTGEFELLPTVIKSGSTNSAKLTVAGQAKVHTLIHYGDQYIELPDKLKTYAELNDVMQRSDFLSSDAELTDQDRALLPANIAIDYAHPTIKNSDETYVDGYMNGLAEFGKQAKYDFNNDSVVFNAQDMKLVTDNKDVTETIHYVYEDGPKQDQKAAEDAVNTVTFTKTGYQNPFTGETKWANNAETKEFKAVDSPTITNYTPDSETIDAITVNQNSDNIVKTVNYKANCSNLHVIYQDDTDNKELSHKDFLNGLIGNSANYNTNDTISNYQNQHYDLVSDETNSQNLTYQDTDKTYVVHFKHHISNVNETSKSTQIVHYVASDNSAVPSDAKHEVSYSRTNQHDDVTDKITNYGTWGPIKTLPDVQTPEKKGYTPDIKEVKGATTTPGKSEDFKTIVTYTPDKQKAKVVFIDDTDHQTLKTVNKDGVTKGDSGYSTKQDIQNYENQHYALVSDTSGGSELIFDDDDLTDQYYEVHLKHHLEDVSRTSKVNETINYVYSKDHSLVKPAYHANAITFVQNGVSDAVTKQTAWSPVASQQFASVTSPQIDGYTADQLSIPVITVNFGDTDIVRTVTYSPDTQNVDIFFIDDTTGQTLKTIKKSGPSDTSTDYNTKNDLDGYKAQHYNVVSDSTNGHDLVFDHTDNVDQHYEVHLSHATHSINEAHDVSQVIHYVYQNGSKAADDYTNHVHFARDGYRDEVTNEDHWNAWKQGSTQTFDAVQSPAVKGYTPDTDQINAMIVNPDSQSIERTVTYTPDAQKLDVTFIDDTTGKTLKTVVKNGVTNADANYSTKSDIQNYESQHYVLVSDSSNGAELVFDNDDAVDQHYEVHLKHATHAINEHHTINETVHYKMSDGTKAPDDYRAEALSFSRDGFNDEVTGIDHWNAWAPKAEQTFGKVASPLVAGYTPDIDQINTQTVKPTDHDLEFTVTYTPNVQIAHVKYIDDTDHKVLTQDDLNGRTGETSGYHTTDRITEFKGQHYVFVSDNYPATGMTFDNNDRFDQMYEVHFTHGTRTDEQDVQVPRTIKYVYQNGQQAQPDHTDALSFHETKVVDLVDGHTVSDDWTPAQDFETVMTPAIQGYTPDHASVSNTGIAHDHSAIVETVTYNPDAQKAVVKYIDDTTGEQLEAKDLAGVSDQSTGYTTKETIDGYINQHYVLVSDGTHGETVVFDHDDDADQSYEVHLKHGTEPANESRIKKITVHYQYADGLARSGKAHDDKTVTNLAFKRTGTHDLVTDKIAWNAWDHTDQTFAEIDSPVIDGYTPDRTVVDNIKVNPDSHDLTEVTVTYNADAQKLTVNFIDDTTGKTLKTVNKIGHSDESADYNTKSDIKDFISKHYDLVSDATNGADLVFDHDDNINQIYEVHLSHHTHQINEQHTVTETVHYQYADGLARSGKAADDFNANALKFSRDGFNDEVTGIDHWNAWTPADQQTFAAVQSPVIEGYTPDQSEIGMINVVPTSQNIEKTVTYTADAQKLTVNFIDDVTGQTLKTVTKTGYSDGDAGYNTKADIQNFVGQHYDVVSDATNGADLVFDHNDSVDQVYNVHFTHHLTPISDHQVVNETIHYVYADGLARTGKAADDYVATPFEFNRTGKHDDVTGTDSWNAWIPGSASFTAVQSPAIQGYTPDHAQIDAVSVDANSQDIVKTVTYSADQQKMTVDFIDDTDNGKVLKTVTKTGGSDEAVGYNTKADIQTFVDSHYKLDHDTSNGENLVFDHDDAVDQHYEVHLTHETAPINEATSTSQVIHYQLADGTPVTKDYTAEVDFSRDGFKDLVTNADHWNAWTPNATQTFDAVASPAKAGYTPDHAQVDAVTVEPHHADLETTVTYSPDAQKATVEYVDDVTGKTLQTKELTGVSDETSTYTTASTIKQYVGQHYKLVSDQTNGKPVAFDHDDDSDQTFEVHLTHTYQDVSQEHQVHQTIHYQYADGKKAQPDYTAKELAFSRTGIQDLVTENIQWNAWTPDQTFAAVNTPALNGYTPDIQTVAPVKVSHDSKNIEQTVIYHADDQTILVNYIDDDTHSTLKTDSIIGKTAQTSDYTTKKSLDQYKGQHYDVVSDDTNGDTLKFDSDSTKVQTYTVHLKHQHQAANDKSTVHQTVHYVYQDGKQAAKDHTATPIEFTRTGDTDLVTGKTTWNAWTPATGTFGAVLSPVIVGYTPSRAMIDHVDVHAGDKDLDTTVTYVSDRQVIIVNYIDQTTGKTLKTDILNGHSDQASGYTTKSQIDSYIGQHYQLISDATNDQALIFDHNDQATQTYDVVLGHQTEATHRTHEVHETIDYVYADGSQAAKSFTAQPIVFSQNGVHDLVTNTTDWNGEWTKPQVFVAVESPKIIGFTASKPEVKAANVNYQSSDIYELVIYAANAQTAQIKYIDDVTRKTLEVDGANGHFNESIVFSHNVNDQISKFKQAHYKLVSNNFAGQKYQADNTKNVYDVHLTHEYQKVHATDAVAETVKFQYADGSQAQPTKTQTVNFGRDGIKDLVTGTTAWMPVDPQTIGAVDVPALDGYTADVQNVPAVTVNFGDGDITKVVTYKANDQLAGIKYIDDETGKTLDTEAASGNFGTKIEFMDDPSSIIQKFEDQGYTFTSNSFNGQKYQADNSKNEFEVHFKHGEKNVSRKSTITRTIKYVDQKTGNEIHQPVVQTLTFTENGVTDLVTGKTTWTTSSEQKFDKVESPKIDGYENPNISVVDTETAKFGDGDQTVIVKYQKVETPSASYTLKTTSHSKASNSLNTSVTTTNTISKATQNISIRTSQTSTQQDTNNHHESQLPQTGNKTDSKLELIGLIGIAFAGLTGLFGFGTSHKKRD